MPIPNSDPFPIVDTGFVWFRWNAHFPPYRRRPRCGFPVISLFPLRFVGPSWSCRLSEPSPLWPTTAGHWGSVWSSLWMKRAHQSWALASNLLGSSLLMRCLAFMFRWFFFSFVFHFESIVQLMKMCNLQCACAYICHLYVFLRQCLRWWRF